MRDNKQFSGLTTALGIIDGVVNYGLVPDGVTDNTAIFETIKTAVGTAPAVLFLRPGSYAASALLTFPTNIEVIGKGASFIGPIVSVKSLSWETASGGILNGGGVPSISAGITADRPAAGVAGRLYVSTDEKKIYRDMGSVWAQISPASYEYVANTSGVPSMSADLIANRPAAATAGRLFVGTDDLRIYRDTGTGWTEVSVSNGGVIDKMMHSVSFEAGGIVTSVTGSGSVLLGGAGIELTTGTTSGSTVNSSLRTMGSIAVAPNKNLKILFRMYTLHTADFNARFGFSNVNLTADIVDSWAGFRLSGTTLVAVTSDGVAATTTTITTTRAAGDQTPLEIHLSATDVKFYQGGALIATHTTNLPSATGARWLFGFIENLVAADKYIDLAHLTIQFDK